MRHYASLTQLTILVLASCWTLSVLHAFSPNPSFRPLGRLSSPWSSSPSSFHHSLANNNKRNRLLTTVLISQQEAPASTGSASDTPTSSSDTNATDTSSSAAAQDPSDPSKRQPTLYEILGASPNATRAELKQSYVHLARQSHPDALLQRDDNESIVNNDVDFSQVAAAWRILSQPQQRKRYDRSLEAQQFADSIEQWGADWTTQAMRPAADWSLQLLENVAMPLFRRTTATTLASLQALSKDLKQPQSSSSRMDSGSNNSTNRASTNATAASVDATFSRAFRNAVQAARRAGRAVDRMELLEKSQALEARAQEELDRANELQAKWHQTAQERLSLSLHTPKSGLTSRDAQVLLQVWNETTVSVDNKQQQQQEPEDEGGVWSWVGRPSVKKEVRELSHAEGAFVQVQSQDAAAQDEYRTAVRERLLARTALVQAQTKAQEALQAYQAAQQNVADRSQQLDRAQHQVTVTELETKKSSIAVQRRASLLEKQSERVRQTLVAKEKQVLKERKKKSKSDQQQEAPETPFQQPHWLPPILQNTTAIQEEHQERLERLASIQKEERALLEESSRMELQAARLLSRAQKLKRRADELETL